MFTNDIKAEQMHKMCLGKRKYRTLEYAMEKAEYYTKKYGKEQYPYYCPLCNNYHLTTHKKLSIDKNKNV